MPVSEAPYKRTYKHTKKRGKERRVKCDACGKKVPRYKTFTVTKGLRIKDPLILKQVDKKQIHLPRRKVRLCPACARFRGITQPGKSVRKKHTKSRRKRRKKQLKRSRAKKRRR